MAEAGLETKSPSPSPEPFPQDHPSAIVHSGFRTSGVEEGRYTESGVTNPVSRKWVLNMGDMMPLSLWLDGRKVPLGSQYAES